MTTGDLSSFKLLVLRIRREYEEMREPSLRAVGRAGREASRTPSGPWDRATGKE